PPTCGRPLSVRAQPEDIGPVRSEGGSGGLGPRGCRKAEFGDGDLAHLELLHLAGTGLREVAADPQIPGDLEWRDLAGTVGAQLPRGEVLGGHELPLGAEFHPGPGAGVPADSNV